VVRARASKFHCLSACCTSQSQVHAERHSNNVLQNQHALHRSYTIMADADEDVIPRTGPSADDIDLSDETQDFRFLAALS
jgi:hypothetical protein